MQSKLLLAATAATGAVAIDLSGTFPRNFRRAIELAPRDEAQCLVAAAQNSAVLEDFPMLPTAEGSALLGIPTMTDPCSFPTVTGSVGSIVTSYSSALESWKDAHVTQLRSVWQACSDVPEFSSVIAQYGDALCSTVLVEITSADASGATGSTPTATATVTGTISTTETAATATDATASASGSASGTASGEASASGEAASTTAQPAAAPKETGLFVAAAAAAAGVLGAVML